MFCKIKKSLIKFFNNPFISEFVKMSSDREKSHSTFSTVYRLLKNARFFDLDVYDTAKEVSKSDLLSQKEEKKLLHLISGYKKLPTLPMSSSSSSSSSSDSDSDSESSVHSISSRKSGHGHKRFFVIITHALSLLHVH